MGAMLQGASDKRVALAVVTSNAYDIVRYVLGTEHATLISYYKCGASLFGKLGKLWRVLKQSGIRPGEAIFIGDEIRNIEAAMAEGTPFGVVAWCYTHAAALEAFGPEQSGAVLPGRLVTHVPTVPALQDRDSVAHLIRVPSHALACHQLSAHPLPGRACLSRGLRGQPSAP